jgi:hypothetical protein
MPPLQFDPAQEKATLYAAIAVLEKQWGKPGMEQPVSALRAAVGRAEQALSVLEQEPNKAPAFVVQVLGLGFLVMYAQGALERAEQFVQTTLERGRHREGPPRTAVDTTYQPARSSVVPLAGKDSPQRRRPSPSRILCWTRALSWSRLTTRFCRGRSGRRLPARSVEHGWCKDGQIHTLQQGWL